MAKTTTVLSGAGKAAYFEHALQMEPKLDTALRERLVARLSDDVRQLRVRSSALAGRDRPAAKASVASQDDAPAPSAPFDPFSPNVVVVVRTEGRDAALAALRAIGDAGNLRLLAREQQLSVDPAVTAPAELCEAIVTAAERRIANRRAAAS